MEIFLGIIVSILVIVCVILFLLLANTRNKIKEDNNQTEYNQQLLRDNPAVNMTEYVEAVVNKEQPEKYNCDLYKGVIRFRGKDYRIVLSSKSPNEENSQKPLGLIVSLLLTNINDGNDTDILKYISKLCYLASGTPFIFKRVDRHMVVATLPFIYEGHAALMRLQTWIPHFNKEKQHREKIDGCEDIYNLLLADYWQNDLFTFATHYLFVLPRFYDKYAPKESKMIEPFFSKLFEDNQKGQQLFEALKRVRDCVFHPEDKEVSACPMFIDYYNLRNELQEKALTPSSQLQDCGYTPQKTSNKDAKQLCVNTILNKVKAVFEIEENYRIRPGAAMGSMIKLISRSYFMQKYELWNEEIKHEFNRRLFEDIRPANYIK